jgi:hypothetical protein
MEEKTTKKYWFRRKSYGWGWGLPLTWQGWVVLLIFLAILVVNFKNIDRIQDSSSDTLINFAPRFIIFSLIFIGICYWKGEPPKWSWGRNRESKNR